MAAADAVGLELAQTVRRVMESQPSVLCGEVEARGVIATFNLGPGGTVSTVWTTVRGEAPAVEAALSLLRSRIGWSLGPGEGELII